jgi:hypothetical protein
MAGLVLDCGREFILPAIVNLSLAVDDGITLVVVVSGGSGVGAG